MRKWIDIVEDVTPRTFSRTSLTSNPDVLNDPKFVAWFGKSKVVDQNGHPLVCYHGTYEDFAEFKHESENRRSYGFNRLGFWFDVDPKTANYFAGAGDTDLPGQKSGSVMPVYLKIEKPFLLNSEYLWDEDREEFSKVRDEWRKMVRLRDTATYRLGSYVLPDGSYLDDHKMMELERKKDTLYQKLMAGRGDGFERLMKLLPKGAKSSDAEVEAFKESLIAEGHDGICLESTIADWSTRDHLATDWWIVFHPNQIKSIYGSKFGEGPGIHENADVNHASQSSPLSEDKVALYMHGYCWALALAMHKLTGLPIVGIRCFGMEGGTFSLIDHAAIDCGDGTYLDARGRLSKSELLNDMIGGRFEIEPMSPTLVREYAKKAHEPGYAPSSKVVMADAKAILAANGPGSGS